MDSVSAFEAFLADMVPSAKSDRNFASENAPEFRALSFFSTGEVISTKILAFFLNPQAPHAQESAFLEAFLSTLGIDLGKTTPRSVSIQTNAPCYTIATRRLMDILMLFKAGDIDYAVVIESKSHNAPDQSNQIHDYLNFIDKKYPKRQRRLYYLSLDGKPPHETSIPPKEWKDAQQSGICRALSYRHVMSHWINQCLRHCEQRRLNKLKFFLEDFATFLGIKYQGAEWMDNSWMKVEKILRKGAGEEDCSAAEIDQFDALLVVFDLHDKIWLQTLRIFTRRLILILKELLPNWIIEPHSDTEELDDGAAEIQLFPPDIKPENASLAVCFAIEPEAQMLFNFYVARLRSIQEWPTSFQFGGKNNNLLRLSPNREEYIVFGQIPSVGNIKSAAAVRSLLTEQSVRDIADSIKEFAEGQWERIQEVG